MSVPSFRLFCQFHLRWKISTQFGNAGKPIFTTLFRYQLNIQKCALLWPIIRTGSNSSNDTGRYVCNHELKAALVAVLNNPLTFKFTKILPCRDQMFLSRQIPNLVRRHDVSLLRM